MLHLWVMPHDVCDAERQEAAGAVLVRARPVRVPAPVRLTLVNSRFDLLERQYNVLDRRTQPGSLSNSFKAS